MKKILLLLSILLLFPCCEDNDPDPRYDVMYEVTGTAQSVNIVYTNNIGWEFNCDVEPPWQWGPFISMEGNHLHLDVRNNTEEGGITATIYIDDAIADQDSCSGGYCMASAFVISGQQ